jgi:hypothetical protein
MIHTGKEGSKTINGKHPQGGATCQGSLFAAQSQQSGPEKFHAPAVNSTFHKIIFHRKSMGKKQKNYAEKLKCIFFYIIIIRVSKNAGGILEFRKGTSWITKKQGNIWRRLQSMAVCWDWIP